MLKQKKIEIEKTSSAENLPQISWQNARDVFGIDCDWQVPVFVEKSEYVPEIDAGYCFHAETTRAILAGFIHGKRVMLQGFHGTGKSSHIEQVAARLNWPCLRVNLDGFISRMDLIGRDAIILEEGKQVTKFMPGILPFALAHPIALVLDEYDAARPEVLFVLQRLLEADGKFTLLDQNKVLVPHKYFRLFATANTVGLGDSSGLYHGTHVLNQGQLDRWSIVAVLNYLSMEEELAIIKQKVPALAAQELLLQQMIAVAALTRQGFIAGDLATVMSPRTVIHWAENYQLFGEVRKSFILSFLNKCDEAEQPLVLEYFERCFGV